VTSAIPVITSSLNVAGSEGLTLNYQITATQNPTSYDAQNLPTGLSINRATGQITGAPVYNGNFTSTISASNQYGIGSATLTFNFSPAQIAGITLDNLGFIYRKPYLLDFPFTLRETSSGAGIVTKATSLSVAAFEDFPPLGGGTSMITNPSPYATLPALVVTEVNAGQTLTPNAVQETGIFVSKGSGKVFKCFLVLDFTDSISDPISNGDTNHDGISDAVDNMVKGAQFFVDQQPGAAQIGVYEFHRDDVSPAKVSGLTKNKQALDAAIAGIWTNYVQGFYAGSRCWDAMTAAIADLGAANPDEQHAIVVVTDGLDYSSIATEDSVIKAAQAAQVQIYCVAYGNNPDTNVLGQITAATRGQLYTAINSPDLFQQLALSSKDVQAQYILRWATLRRAPTPFLPDFQLTFQGFSAGPPAWTWQMGQNLATNIDNTTTPPTTNVVTNLFGVWSNPRLGPYDVTNWAGPVTNGTLRIVTDDEVQPTGLTIRATYTPRFIRMMKFHYRANWPCTAILDSTSDYLANWTLSETPDGSGGKWVLLSSSNTVDQSTSLPFGWFGPLFTLKFEDVLLNTSNALSFITVDNSIYTNIPAGGQTFAFETNAVGSTNAFVTAYPPMPHGTPVPWIIQYNLAGAANSNAWAPAALAYTDGDGVPNWKEYVANTNPTNSASKFFIRNITRLSNGRAQITFTTTINRTYRVEASSDLVNWQTVQDLIPAINADVTITDTRYVPGVIGLFYRVVVY